MSYDCQTERPELLPCPFCGGPVTGGYYAFTYNIDCAKCSLNMDFEACDGKITSAEHASYIWNNRAYKYPMK